VADAFLDTTFFIDVHRGTYPGADEVWRNLLSGRLTGAYSPISAYELWVGQSISRDEELFYEFPFERLEEVPLTGEAARRAGFWLRGSPRNSADRRVTDAFIAASASLRNETVYTANARDFLRFDILVRSYR
jgi:predicted nucleic acid-binding protein